MAKRDDASPAEEYIEQLQWQSRHRRRYWPIRYEPKWKFKIVYRRRPVSPFGRALLVAMWTVLLLLAVYVVAANHNQGPVGEKIFFGLVFGLIVTILFLAARDSSDHKKNRE